MFYPQSHAAQSEFSFKRAIKKKTCSLYGLSSPLAMVAIIMSPVSRQQVKPEPCCNYWNSDHVRGCSERAVTARQLQPSIICCSWIPNFKVVPAWSLLKLTELLLETHQIERWQHNIHPTIFLSYNVFELWGETGEHEENPRMHSENMQSPHRKAGAEIRNTAFRVYTSIWGPLTFFYLHWFESMCVITDKHHL